ncbi:CaiB/BaiF CoA transferase family protein [Candidatus Raskinella chloraquaticus]|uniref:CoA-transferase n=1 Tax=Candidatus Raskinella chloraquaticus TaxID=1951219 RepID=A0A1W9I432_9HYPH|nr:MAG: CoA-transferase [Proteobacteria bacterium SG_bin8]
MTRPLDGLLVVSLEQAIAAPYCSRRLADQGARVIKVERPDGGDFARAYDERARGLSSHFVWCNRSKESLTLDLKQADDVAALKRIIAHADVFIQNLAPGAVARLGLDAPALRATHPRLICCSISGYGEGGPWSARKAYDLLIQAEGGFLSITGTAETPVKAGISIVDIAAGVAAESAILAALIRRERTGEGDIIDISMLEALTEWMGYPLYYACDGASPPSRSGAEHATIYPYGPFKTADGVVLFGLQNDREWESFAAIVLERPDLASDVRFRGNAGRAQHRALLDDIVVPTLAGLSTSTAMARLDNAGIGTARVNSLADVWAHPQLAARARWGMVETPNGAIPSLMPVAGSAWTGRMDGVPALGQHTAAILAEFADGEAVGISRE